MSEHTELDQLDKNLLNIIQSNFPIAPRPYAVIADLLGTSEEEAFKRVRKLRSKKIIRRMGANFQSSRLNFRSTLCAAKVPDDKLNMFTAKVNACPGVTHNYLRANIYNVWFTMIGENWDLICAELEKISNETGIKILNLPATRLYKIKVDFAMN